MNEHRRRRDESELSQKNFSDTNATANSCARPSPFPGVHPQSPAPAESTTNSSITNLNDFPPEGIRQMPASTVSSSRACRQRILPTSQSQIDTLAQPSRSHSVVTAHHQNETLLLRRENEFLRERLAKLEGSLHTSNSSSIIHGSKSSSNDHHHRHGNLAKDVYSNVSSHSASSIIHHEAGIEHPQYSLDTTMNNDRKRR